MDFWKRGEGTFVERKDNSFTREGVIGEGQPLEQMGTFEMVGLTFVRR